MSKSKVVQVTLLAPCCRCPSSGVRTDCIEMNCEGRSIERPKLQGSWSGSYQYNNCNSSCARRGHCGVVLPCWMIIPTSSLTALQSSVDLLLLNGILPDHSVFDLFFQFVILRLLISVCTQFHHLCLGRPLSRLPWWLLLNTWLTLLGLGSSVGIASAYGLDGPGIESQWGRDFPHLSRPALRPTQPAALWVSVLSRG